VCVLSRVCVDYIRRVLDCQLGLLDQTQLHTITVYTLHYSLSQLQLFSEYCCSARILTRISLSKLHSRSPSAATWLSVYSLGPDPIGNTALVLFSGQLFPSDAFFLSCLSSRYQVTSTPQAYMSQYHTEHQCRVECTKGKGSQ
jgi:hypothetical protein